MHPNLSLLIKFHTSISLLRSRVFHLAMKLVSMQFLAQLCNSQIRYRATTTNKSFVTILWNLLFVLVGRPRALHLPLFFANNSWNFIHILLNFVSEPHNCLAISLAASTSCPVWLLSQLISSSNHLHNTHGRSTTSQATRSRTPFVFCH